MSQSETHNLLARRFVHEIIGPAIKDGATYGDLMVIFESAQFCMMEVLNLHYELAPAVAVGLCEECLHAASERFAGNRAANHERGRASRHLVDAGSGRGSRQLAGHRRRRQEQGSGAATAGKFGLSAVEAVEALRESRLILARAT
ncbi:hypothetical protein AJ88_03710 [Mesorhizobium amorphae CCBAU 01583]|nr:hypothetical protein AJ88_03710 [Mesorhizobium amorphae CCBAU 01583]